MRVMLPSTGPEVWRVVKAATMAARSRRMPPARVRSSRCPSRRTSGKPDVEGEVLVAAFSEHGGKAAGVVGGGRQRRTSFAEVLEVFALHVGEPLGSAHDPAGDAADSQAGHRGMGRDCPVAVGPQVAADGVDVAAVAQLVDLPSQLGGVGAAFHPAVMEVEPVVIEDAGAVGGCDQQFLDVGGVGEAPDRQAADLEFAGDGPQAVATLNPLMYLLVALAGAGNERPGPSVEVEFAGLGGGASRGCFRLVERFAQVGSVPTDDALHGFGEIVQQMPDVSHLGGLRRPAAGAVPKRLRPDRGRSW
jgi:hypothetical protein